MSLLAGDGSAPPPGFQVTLARAQGSAETLVCPQAASAPSDNQRCASDGFDVRAWTGALEVTVRSTGNVFLSSSLMEGAGSPTTLTLEPLPIARKTEDYATRWDGDSCLDDLEQFAVPFATDVGNSLSVKFYVPSLNSLPEVYFQNTKKFPLHYDFAQRVLGVTADPSQFAADTYSGKDRTAAAGTLIFYPNVTGPAQGADSVEAPWTLDFFSSDDLDPEHVRLVHRLVEERITCLRWTGPSRRLVYVPAGTVQEDQAKADARAFSSRGIAWMSHEQLYQGISQQALNPGVAYGTLRRLTPEELETALVSFHDVILLTRLPNEVPIVGGTITEEYQTPLAHVNVAARTRGTPNLAYPKAFADPNVASLIGRLVRFEVGDGSFSLREATLDEAQAFWNSRVSTPVTLTSDLALTGIPSFDQVGFADSVRIGVKAANLAELSHFLGDNAPPSGLAVPFYYYQKYMDSSQSSAALCDAAQADCIASHRDPTACQGARALCLVPGAAAETFSAFLHRVLDDPSFQQDTALREAVLATLRYLIEHSPVDSEFGALLDRRVAEVFQGSKVKIRSSTNCEDLSNFSGAGLYNSYGAHATGADAASKVIVKVFSSVWSFRGFEERSFWNIDHRAVRMGCAINESFSKERANGVLITSNIADPTVYGMYVNAQKGEESVTNPTNGALPEVFSIVDGPQKVEVVRQRFSSLSPSTPLLTDGQIQSLHDAAAKARAHFAPLYGKSTDGLILDMEFKLTSDEKIVFKQARPYTPSAYSSP